VDEQTGKMVQTSNQETSSIGLGFQRAKDGCTPVAMIAGKLTDNATLVLLLSPRIIKLKCLQILRTRQYNMPFKTATLLQRP
jgi:hypothetical protein